MKMVHLDTFKSPIPFGLIASLGISEQLMTGPLPDLGTSEIYM